MITRSIYLLLPRSIAEPEFDLLHVLNALYGRSDSCHYWHDTLARVIKHDIGIRFSKVDPGLYVAVPSTICGLFTLVVNQVDYVLSSESPQSYSRTMRLEPVFHSKRRTSLTLSFAGGLYSTFESTSFILHQAMYASRLQPLDLDATFERYCKLRHQWAWLGQTQPHVVGTAIIASQVTAQSFERIDIKLLNTAVRRAQSYPYLGLPFQRLDPASLQTVVFVDRSFSNNCDFSNQLVFKLFLCIMTTRAICLFLTSYKSKRAVQSVLEGRHYTGLWTPMLTHICCDIIGKNVAVLDPTTIVD